MQFATAGNLDSFLLTRSHSPLPDVADQDSFDQLAPADRIKAFKKRRQSSHGRREEMRGILQLGKEEIRKLFGDVVEGLAFLVGLDSIAAQPRLRINTALKLGVAPGLEVLERPVALGGGKAHSESHDFGFWDVGRNVAWEARTNRSYRDHGAPETLMTDAQGHFRPSDSHVDIWSLGWLPLVTPSYPGLIISHLTRNDPAQAVIPAFALWRDAGL
ncbi:hypothetical protein P7C73_g323, partial [Tremellales sp. Uapishka_1]